MDSCYVAAVYASSTPLLFKKKEKTRKTKEGGGEKVNKEDFPCWYPPKSVPSSGKMSSVFKNSIMKVCFFFSIYQACSISILLHMYAHFDPYVTDSVI